MKDKRISTTILWWGRFNRDYSRNRILRNLLEECGYDLHDFIPRSSLTCSFEVFFASLPKIHAVWVPAFRQRDFAAARRFADKHSIPLIFDPLISAWEKTVFERNKHPENSPVSQRLLRWERSLFSGADLVIADTPLHAEFFIDTLYAAKDSTVVIPVGSEESLFTKQSSPAIQPGVPPEILFYGSFINLQAPEVIIEAARQVPQARWTLLGDGPLRKVCEQKSSGCEHIRFEDWTPYGELARRIGQADILLGVFGASAKAGRVIPNKVYQALACGRPVITRQSDAYPNQIAEDSGITFIPAADPDALVLAVREALARRDLLGQQGINAHQTHTTWFSETRIKQDLIGALAKVNI
ncbi:MAG: glycosyltransferase [Desulforhopalus sp.]